MAQSTHANMRKVTKVSRWWRRLFRFQCSYCDDKQDRAIDHVSHVKIRTLTWQWDDVPECLPKRPACNCMLDVDKKLVGMKLYSHCCYEVKTGCDMRMPKSDICAGAYLKQRHRHQPSDLRGWLPELLELPKICPIPRNWSGDCGLNLKTPVFLGPTEIGWPKVATAKKKAASKKQNTKQVAKKPAAKKQNTKQFEKKPETVP